VLRMHWVRLGVVAMMAAMPLACTNNPFNPRAELTVTEVSPPTATGTATVMPAAFSGMIGIAMDLSTSVPAFIFADPQVTIQNGDKQPEAYLNEAVINVTLGNTQLPTKRFPLNIVVPKGGKFTGLVPFLRGDPDVRNAVFPNGTPTLGTQGMAAVTLVGRDKNGNETSVNFTAPLSFTTIGALPSAAPSATVTAGASPAPTPTTTP